MNPVPLFLLAISLPLLLGGCEKKPINNLRVDDFKVGDMVSVQTHKEILLPSGEVIKITPESIYVEWTRENEYGFEATDGIELPRDEVGKDTFLIHLEEKVLEVKEEVKTEEAIAETKPKLEGGNSDELEFRGKLYNENVYLNGSLYTGKSFSLHENGQKKGEANYKGGKQYGLFFRWHINGKKYREGNCKDGKVDGLFVEWYENGQKWAEVNWKDGKKEGIQLTWHENRQKKAEVNWKNNIALSEKYWNSKGEPVDSREEARRKGGMFRNNS